MTGWQTVTTPVAGLCSLKDLLAYLLTLDGRMVQPVSTPQTVAPATQSSRGLAPLMAIGGAGLVAAILLGAVVLWFHYGTTVFFEMIASGVAACF